MHAVLLVERCFETSADSQHMILRWGQLETHALLACRMAKLPVAVAVMHVLPTSTVAFVMPPVRLFVYLKYLFGYCGGCHAVNSYWLTKPSDAITRAALCMQVAR